MKKVQSSSLRSQTRISNAGVDWLVHAKFESFFICFHSVSLICNSLRILFHFLRRLTNIILLSFRHDTLTKLRLLRIDELQPSHTCTHSNSNIRIAISFYYVFASPFNFSTYKHQPPFQILLSHAAQVLRFVNHAIFSWQLVAFSYILCGENIFS